MANQFLGLSLFIMLLSFFIILNALSDFDDSKAAPVLNSLSETFLNLDERFVKQGDVPSTGASSNSGTTVSRIYGLFQAHISGLEMRQNRMGTEMRLHMPFDDFEKIVTTSLKPRKSVSVSGDDMKDGFLNMLSSLLDTREEGATYKMDMVYYVSAADTEDIVQKKATSISSLAGKIEGAGIPAKMISAGISNGREGMIDIYFRPYQPFDWELYQSTIEESGVSDDG